MTNQTLTCTATYVTVAGDVGLSIIFIPVAHLGASSFTPLNAFFLPYSAAPPAQQAQSISFTAPPSTPLTGPAPTLGATATSGLPVSYSSNSTGVCTVAGASVTLGKRLSDRLYAAYEHSLAGTGGALMIFYELSRRWSLRGQAGETSAVDLIYKLSFD